MFAEGYVHTKSSSSLHEPNRVVLTLPMMAGAPPNPDDPDMENDSPCDDPEDMSRGVVNTADNLRTGPGSGPFKGPEYGRL